MFVVLGNEVRWFSTAGAAVEAIATHEEFRDVADWRLQLTFMATMGVGLRASLPLPRDPGELLALLFGSGVYIGAWFQ